MPIRKTRGVLPQVPRPGQMTPEAAQRQADRFEAAQREEQRIAEAAREEIIKFKLPKPDPWPGEVNGRLDRLEGLVAQLEARLGRLEGE